MINGTPASTPSSNVALNVIIYSLYTEQIYKGNTFVFSVPANIQQLRTEMGKKKKKVLLGTKSEF